jgi:hypothetical protein
MSPITFSGGKANPLLEKGGQGVALHELHGEIGNPAFLADIKKRDDVRVRKRSRDARFVVEALDEGFVLGTLARDVQPDRLDGKGSLDEGVEGFVDRPHGAVADAALDLIAAYRRRHLLGEPALLAHRPVDGDSSIKVKMCQRNGASSGRDGRACVDFSGTAGVRRAYGGVARARFTGGTTARDL